MGEKEYCKSDGISAQSELPKHKNNQGATLAVPSARQEMDGIIRPIQSSPKVRKIDAPLISSINGLNTLTGLRNTWLGQYYVSHLKQYEIVRYIFQWSWRNVYPLYVKFIYVNFLIYSFSRKEIQWRSLTKLSEFVKRREIPICKLADKVSVETPEPEVFPVGDQAYLESPHDHYQYPDIFVATINNGMINGGTNLVLADDEVIVCHDLYDFKRDYTSEEMHGRAIISPKFSLVCWLSYDKEPVRIPAAATFVDACAPNYAHWLTEVLPRVAIFCADERFKNIPIVVNDGLHENIMESLFLVAGPEREIITLPIGRALFCEELYVTSVAGYVPFERRSKKLSGHSHGLFSPLAFDLLRNILIDSAQNAGITEWPEKIFLRRNSEIRNVVNAAEVEKLLTSRGYVVLEPEKLTFSQQVKFFSNAKVIVSSSGAAMANMLFAPRDARIIILIGKYHDTSYWYWQNMACASGKTVSYVLGKISKRNIGGIHASFSVDLESLESSIS